MEGTNLKRRNVKSQDSGPPHEGAGAPVVAPFSFKDELHRSWWIYSDCCGLVCSFITLGLHIFAYVVQMAYILGPHYGIFSWQSTLYTCFSGLAVASHCKCQFTNPGTIPKHIIAPGPLDEETRKRYVCKRTKVIKPPTSHYCREAHRVTLRMDHYCPWVNNIVGLFTQKYFLLFIFYTFCCCAFCGVTLFRRFWACQRSGRGRHRRLPPWDVNYGYCDPPFADVILCAFNFVEAIFFALFTGIMSYDQFEAVSQNAAYIDRLQGKKGAERSLYENLKDVFGSSFNLRWLLPMSPHPNLRRHFEDTCRETYMVLCKKRDMFKVYLAELRARTEKESATEAAAVANEAKPEGELEVEYRDELEALEAERLRRMDVRKQAEAEAGAQVKATLANILGND